MAVTGSGATSSAFARLQWRLRAPARQVPPSPDCNGGYGPRGDKVPLRPTGMAVTGSGATSSAFARRNGVSGFGGTSAHLDIHRRDTDERQVESGVEQTNRKSTPDV